MTYYLRFIVPLLLLLATTTCTDPVTPIFDFKAGFLLVEGRITDEPGLSQVRIARNEILFDNYVLQPVNGAQVSSVDNDGQEVSWLAGDEPGLYVAPDDFVAESGRSYSLRAITPSGELVESSPEPLPTKVPINDLRIRFEQEAYFSESRERFIPAFNLLATVDDPADEENYYEYVYTAFEDIAICASCVRARYRNGECIEGPDTRFVTRWDYLCDVPCWISSRSSGRTITSDAFSNGLRMENIDAGRLDYTRPGGLLFVVEQYNTSRGSFRYNSVIEGLTEGSGGLNAPLPAALVGNLSDLSERNTEVLGYVSVAAVSTDRVYINRDTVDGQSLPWDGAPRLEPVVPAPPTAPCVGGSRSPIRPEGWPR